jgi:hypothetical protein
MPRVKKVKTVNPKTSARKRKRPAPVKVESPPPPAPEPVPESPPPKKEEIAQMEELLASVPAETVEKAVASVKKARRPPTAYNLFCKEMMATEAVKALPNRERFAFISQEWAKKKAGK